MTDALTVQAPYDGATLGQVPQHDADAIEQALTTAHALYRNHDGWLAVHERVAILERVAEIMTDRHAELSLQAAREGGKPLTDSQAEVTRGIDGIRLAIETIRSDAGEVIPMQGTPSGGNRLALTQKEPIGVVVAVSAFNHPLNLIVHQVGAAVAAGCPVLVKPAEDTPLSCHSFVKIVHEAGLDPDWCQFVLPPNHELAEKLVTDPRVAFFTFIGSARVGWMLRSKLAPGTRCALEHGGVAPVILAADADLDHAVKAIAKGGFYHAGQVCVSVQRVYAEASVARDFAERLTRAARNLRVGDPAHEDTEVGPLIRQGEVDRVHEWVTEAVDAGTEMMTGGEPMAHQCYAPTVLFDPADELKVSQQEIFGPVVCVYPYSDLDDAIARANALPYSFQAATFTNELSTALRVYKRIDASAVMVNDHTAFRVDGMPFAGLRQSGLGTGGIPYTIDDMQVDKMLVMHSPEL